MSLLLSETLEPSQQAVSKHVSFLYFRHQRICRLMESAYGQLAEHGMSVDSMAKLIRVLRVYSKFAAQIIDQVACLQEERNMYYFSMKDLEEILFNRQNET